MTRYQSISRIGRHPRSQRRGLAALTATLYLAGILLSLSVFWAVTQGRQNIAGEAELVSEAVTRSGYGLHHWLHEARSGSGFVLPAQGAARALTSAEEAGLTSHGAWADWMRPTRRWQINRFIGMPGNQQWVTDQPHGILVVRLIGTPGTTTWDTGLPHGILIVRPPACVTDRDRLLRSEVAQRLGIPLGTSDAAEGPALDLIGTAAQDCDLVVFAHPFSRIDPDLVLREARAGFPPPVMTTNLDMGGHDITDTGTLLLDQYVTDTLTIGTDVTEIKGVGKIDGSLLIDVETPIPSPRLTLHGNLDVIETVALTTLGQNGDPLELDVINYGAIDTIPHMGSAPALITNPNTFYCGNCTGGTQ